jgi:hypothetical protein
MTISMAHADAFTLPHSDLNSFLFADVGVEASGNMLSVLSAFARMGLDPWQEGGRLARLPRPAAVDALAGLIAKMPASLWPLPVATAIAARLVALLPPSRGPFDTAPQAAGAAALRGRLQLAVVFVVLATAFAGLASSLTDPKAAAPVSQAAASGAAHPGASPPAAQAK